MVTANIRKAKKNLSGLIKKACDGQEVIITRGSKAVARLVAIAEAKKQRTPGSMKGKFEIGPEFFEPLPEEELAAWEGSDGDPPEEEK